MGRGATLGSTEWRNLTDAEFGLNADGGCASYDRNFRPLGCGISTAEKTFQTYFFTAHNPGGHSSRPRPDNAIYELADALKALQAHRFTPMLNDTSRGYFEERAKQEGNSALGQQIRAWLANPERRRRGRRDRSQSARSRPDPHALRRDHAGGRPRRQRAAADRPRRRSIAGSCRGSIPRPSRPNCSSSPGPRSRSTPDPELHRPADAGVAAAARRVQSGHRRDPALPRSGDARLSGDVDRGERRQLLPRQVGIPVYDVDGSWGISPDDERAHGLDERLPVRAMYDDVLHWEMMLRDLAGK